MKTKQSSRDAVKSKTRGPFERGKRDGLEGWRPREGSEDYIRGYEAGHEQSKENRRKAGFCSECNRPR